MAQLDFMREHFPETNPEIAPTTAESQFAVTHEEWEATLHTATKCLRREIRRRQKAEAQLSAEKNILSVTLHAIRDGVITTDLDDRIILMNRMAEKLTGWRKEMCRGNPLSDIVCMFDESSHEPIMNPAKAALRTSPQFCHYAILRSKRGKERVIEYTARPIHDEKAVLAGTVFVIRDISKERRLEEERLKASRLESLGFLAGGIAHDFNNLLTAIWGNISLAKLNRDINTDLVEILGRAENAAKRARTLTQQLLTFSKGGAPIKKTAALPELIKESVAFVVRGKNVECEFNFADDLHPSEVDEAQISLVVNNLAINAIQAMPNGGHLRIKAKNTRITQENALPLKNGFYVLISVQDNGKGIAENDIEHVFDPYFTTKQMGLQKGCGLGLATSYSIVKRHGGLMTVASAPETGSTFYIYLPATKAKPVSERKQAELELVRGNGRVLVMDDEEMLREMSRKCLGRMGYEVVTAADGKEAIKLYRKAQKKNPFDAVVMDLTIPGGMGGKETIARLKKIDPFVKAVVSSGYSNDPVMSDHRKYGFSAVIAKPYQLSELNSILARLVISKN